MASPEATAVSAVQNNVMMKKRSGMLKSRGPRNSSSRKGLSSYPLRESKKQPISSEKMEIPRAQEFLRELPSDLWPNLHPDQHAPIAWVVASPTPRPPKAAR